LRKTTDPTSAGIGRILPDRCLDYRFHRICDLAIGALGLVLVDQRGAHAVVTHPRHQGAALRAAPGRCGAGRQWSFRAPHARDAAGAVAPLPPSPATPGCSPARRRRRRLRRPRTRCRRPRPALPAAAPRLGVSLERRRLPARPPYRSRHRLSRSRGRRTRPCRQRGPPSRSWQPSAHETTSCLRPHRPNRCPCHRPFCPRTERP